MSSDLKRVWRYIDFSEMYLAVLNALGLQDDILLLAKDDELGRTILDLEIKTPRRVKNKQ